MLYEIFKFEILYRIKRAETYIFFIFLFLFSLVGVDFMYGSDDLGPIKLNAPLIIAKTMSIISGMSLMIASLIMGVPILRDFEHQIESLMFVNPIIKRDYLLGRFLGSFVILVLIFSALIFGNALGELLPWKNPEQLLPFNLMTYVQPYFTVVLPMLFFGSTLFFVTGALSKKLLVVYTQGLFTFVLFLLTRSIENRFVAAILDPFSLTTLTELTANWNPEEINKQLMPFSGVLFYSKLFWVIIGLLIFAFGYKRFKFQVVSNSSKKRKKSVITVTDKILNSNYELPIVKVRAGLKSQLSQLLQNAWFYFISILKEVSFWAIVISAMVMILINSINLGTVYGVNSHPATYFIIEELLEMSSFFFIIVMVFYSGELIWKERGVKLNLIYDALPSNNSINLLGKFIGLALTYIVIMLSLIVAGVIFQISHGYYKFEMKVYFISFFVDLLPLLLLYTIVSFFIHVLVNKKFVAYIIMLTFFIVSIAMKQLGYDHDLYMFAGNMLGTYSQMNGFGHFLIPFIWIKAYWFAFSAFLMLITTLFFVRGTETNFKIRLQQAKQRITPSVLKTGLVIGALFIGLGSFIFYNTNVLNVRWSSSKQIEFRVGYERELKQYEKNPQPTLIDVSLKVELYPSTRDYTAEGRFTYINTTLKPMQEIHVQKRIENGISLEYLKFNKEGTLNTKHLQYDYYVYQFNSPLQPGDSINMSFKQNFTTKGFVTGSSNMKVVENGTFFNNSVFPTIGYNSDYELRRNKDRKAAALPPRTGMASRDDAFELKNGVTGDDGYRINFEIVIGTEANQTAISPGKLLKSWEKDNRAYFHYKTDNPMINFYSIVSARYEVARDKWTPKSDSFGVKQPIDLEIYYHKGHDYNIKRMFNSMKKSFTYYSTNFSPYQYQQMRIMEFPRYASFAQSFPNTVPFSESIGFVLDINDEKDVDMAFYVTAHELAHQWWGLQVVAANVKGKNMVLETLSQYSALMVLKKEYGTDKVVQFLEGELDTYLENRKNSVEVPLSIVEKDSHIYYNKGAVSMYHLQELIGEKQLNLALNRFIKDWNAFDSNFNKKRYATSDDLLQYIYEVTPVSLKSAVHEILETVTTYDASIKKADVQENVNDSFTLNVQVTLDKWQSDLKGKTIKVIPNTIVAMSIFGFDVDGKEQLLETKEIKLNSNSMDIILNYNSKPSKIVLDSNNLLIDTNRDNNYKKLY